MSGSALARRELEASALVIHEYRDAEKQLRRVPHETVQRIEAALAAHTDGADSHPVVVRRGAPLPAAKQIETESGVVIPAPNEADRSVPFGYHTLVHGDGRKQPLIVCPPTCCLPRDLDGWGLALQLYSARSHNSWGVGDFGDLATVTEWAQDQAARFVLLNPLHAPLPIDNVEPSPYFPSSRLFRNPIYLDIERVPHVSSLASELEDARSRGRHLNSSSLLDRNASWRLKKGLLEKLWTLRTDWGSDFDRYVAAQGIALERYSTFSALTEDFGAGFSNWSSEYRNADSHAVAEFAATHRNRVRFHQWLQWLIHEQLVSVAGGTSVQLIHDLAVGVNRDGADAWCNPGLFVDGFNVGAPPDRFNTQGQDWGLPPINPWRLRALAYKPFIDMLRCAFAAAGGVRIDHVMGLFRLWWVPRDGSAKDGAYVRYPAEELLDIAALESHRAGAFVIGEDLGTVGAGVRDMLRARKVLSYRLLLFGDNRALPRYPRRAMAAATTHDLPTVAGLWTRSDVTAQAKLGLKPNERATEVARTHLQKVIGLADDASIDDVVVATYAALNQAPSRLRTVCFDDLALSELRPNMPGTMAPTWPNWQIPLPQPLEQILASQPAHRIAAALRS